NRHARRIAHSPRRKGIAAQGVMRDGLQIVVIDRRFLGVVIGRTDRAGTVARIATHAILALAVLAVVDLTLDGSLLVTNAIEEPVASRIVDAVGLNVRGERKPSQHLERLG